MGTLTAAGLIIRLSALAVLLFLSALFSATETAFTSLSVIQVSQQASKGRRGRLIRKLTERPDNMLTTILLGNNLVNIAATSLATEMTIRGAGESAVPLMTLLLTLVVLIFSEVTPKRIALVHNEWVARRTVVLIWLLSYILIPFIVAIRFISRVLSRPFAGKQKRPVSMEGILHMVSMAEDIGVVEKYEKSMVRNVFLLNDVPVETIMTRRQDVFSLPEELTVNEALPKIRESHFSRIPLYDREPENISGIVLEREILKASIEGLGQTPLKDYLHSPAFISEAKKVDELFTLFKTNHLKMAVILDEYGGLAGIVTQEDVVEEIFGDLYDENEEKEEEMIIRVAGNRWKVKGECPIHLISDELKLNIPPSRYAKTLAGFLMEKTGQIPLTGAAINHNEFRFVILTKERNRIVEVLAIKKTGAQEPRSDQSPADETTD